MLEQFLSKLFNKTENTIIKQIQIAITKLIQKLPTLIKLLVIQYTIIIIVELILFLAIIFMLFIIMF